MLGRLARWAGEWGVVTLTVWLAWEQVKGHLEPWTLYAVLGAVGFFALLSLPIGKNEDGSAKRLVDITVRGRGHTTNVTGDRSPQINSRDGSIHAHAEPGGVNNIVQLTRADAKQNSINAGESLLLPEINSIGSPEARATAEEIMKRRLVEFTDMTLDRINMKDPALYSRFADPRFLAPLARAHRSYAETGDKDLGNTLAKLLADLAAEPIRSRREIVLREAIDCAPRLTNRHLNLLSVIAQIDQIRHTDIIDTDELIDELYASLSPYIGEVPTDAFEYEYMSATSVGTYIRKTTWPAVTQIHGTHRNSMYPALIAQDFVELKINQSEVDKYFAPLTADDDVTEQDRRYRLEHKASEDLKNPKYNDPKSPDHDARLWEIYEMLEARSINIETFGEQIREKHPDLSNFLDILDETHALDFDLSPVGIMLAKHQISDIAADTAALFDGAFETN